MNTEGFTLDQKEALFDLLLLGMYADGHIAAAEDKRVNLMLDSFELESDYARQQFAQAAFGRVNRRDDSDEALRGMVFERCSRFQKSQRRQALEALAELLASDNRVTGAESRFLVMVEEALELRPGNDR